MSTEKHRRLLDMLAGWSQYCDESGKPVDAERIAELYQQAGEMEHMEDNGKGTDLIITDFVVNCVLPFIRGDK